jgi:DNA-directed RNA polymerase sigma subunit (sigma70/sigma32)
MIDNEISKIKVDVGVLKTQVFTLSQLCEKMDKVIERLVDVHDQHISKVYDTMNNQRKEKDDDISEIHERIDVVLDKVQETESRIMEEIKGLKKSMGEHSATSKLQFEQLNKWKWSIAGGIFVLTWLLSKTNIDTILHSFK